MANVGNVFIKRLQTLFFFNFVSTFLKSFLNVSFYFYLKVYYIYAANDTQTHSPAAVSVMAEEKRQSFATITTALRDSRHISFHVTSPS